jgi:EAL domain-containing protein (putative c-di-GMP-specific phosphodiesterase class I)
VLRSVCQQAQQWISKGFSPLRMAVNISGRQLRHKKFVEFVTQLLQEFKLEPEYLELELNEYIILDDEDKKIIQTLMRLHDLGVKIALDDFGTGFSSISYLKRFPIDRIKIDKSFIDKISINHEDAAIVKAIITLATTMHIEVVAEGVETLKQLQMLTDKEKIGVQGFYISHALPVEEVEKFLVLYQNG